VQLKLADAKMGVLRTWRRRDHTVELRRQVSRPYLKYEYLSELSTWGFEKGNIVESTMLIWRKKEENKSFLPAPLIAPICSKQCSARDPA
jgi:hypothetical protein